jgi:hypothetical protein
VRRQVGWVINTLDVWGSLRVFNLRVGVRDL